MAGWFGGNAATAEFDRQVEEATASSLSNLALNLEIADTIRSGTVPPKTAMQTLKRRLANKNPNVQLSTLDLLDSCVKNGGAHFLQEIASREFMDSLVALVRYDSGTHPPPSGEREVRGKLLELIQTWSLAAAGRDNLSYLSETYRTLQTEGCQFPPRAELTSSMFDSTAPPEWTDSEVCMRCREKFTFTNRRHHCRNCGNVFDQNCSSKSLPLPHLGIMTAVRVDDGCYAKLVAKSGGGGGGGSGGQGMQSPSGGVKRTLWQESRTSGRGEERMAPRPARVVEESGFDADLKRALEMSLEESGGQGGAGYVSQAQLQQQKPADTNGASKTPAAKKPAPVEEEPDADLAAAIAASLRDMETQKSLHAASLQRSSSTSHPQSAQTPFPRPNPAHELTPVESESIHLFATLVDRL
ncbi:Vacuolar protein-sorting-associated protein 27, partial [Teratosphaeriaceae sp. CCFEE 6253]